MPGKNVLVMNAANLVNIVSHDVQIEPHIQLIEVETVSSYVIDAIAYHRY